jgi:hypothetical protein
MAQLKFTAPFYAGMGYSLSSWICLRTGLDRRLISSLMRWEEERFGSRDNTTPADIKASTDRPL